MTANNNDIQFISIRITRQAHEYLLKLRDTQANEKRLSNFTITDCASLAILNTPLITSSNDEDQPEKIQCR